MKSNKPTPSAAADRTPNDESLTENTPAGAAPEAAPEMPQQPQQPDRANGTNEAKEADADLGAPDCEAAPDEANEADAADEADAPDEASAASDGADTPDTPAQRPLSLRERMRERYRRRRRALRRRLEYQRLRRLRKHTVPAYTHCKNCGERLQGMYCHRCGQYALDIEQPFWKYIKQYFENVYQFDSKVWRTLWLLFRRPGFLTSEFNAGKINSYVHPFRLYMFISVIFFTLFFMAASGSAEAQMHKERYGSYRFSEQMFDALRSGRVGADTCIYIHDGVGLAEMLEVHGIGSDTLLRITPLESRHGLARVELPRMLLDSCLYVTKLSEKDSLNFAIARQALADAEQTSDAEQPEQLAAEGEAGAEAPDEGTDTQEAEFGPELKLELGTETQEDPYDWAEPSAIEALRGFDPGRTPVYDWRKAQSQSERLERMNQQTMVNNVLAQLSKWTPLYMMFLLPLFALLLAWSYRRCRMNYMQHFVHAIHINCFFLIVVSVPAFLLIFSFDPESDLSFSGNVVLGFFALVFLYMLVSSRTVYRRGWWRTLFKTLWIFLFFTLMAGLIAAALLLWLIYTYQESI